MNTNTNRFAVIINNDLVDKPGLVANVAAIAIGGLKCDGFIENIQDKNGIGHASILWNMPVLKSKRQRDFLKVNKLASDMGLMVSAFSKEGMTLSNSYEEYKKVITESEQLTILSMAIYGEDSLVKQAVKSLSVL